MTRPLSLQETSKLIDWAQSILERLRTDLRLAHEAVYGINARPDDGGRPAGSHSDPSARPGRGNPDDQRPDRWEESAALLTLAGKWLTTATAHLVNVDDAVGRALLKTDPHRGIPDHVQAPFHDPQALYPGRPDLQAAHAAKQRRHARGDL